MPNLPYSVRNERGLYKSRRPSIPLAIVLLFILLLLPACSPTNSGQGVSSKAAATQQLAKAQFTYVAIGASDTFGIGTSDPYTQNWASDLATDLGSRVHLINLGIPGILLHDALRIELPVAIDSHPRLVTIWLAANDIIANVNINDYARDFNILLSQLRASAPHAIIAVANMPDLTLLPRFSTQSLQVREALHATILNYNAVIDASASRYHAILVDLFRQGYNLKQHPEFVSSDGFHPNELGYAQIANLFYQDVRGVLPA